MDGVTSTEVIVTLSHNDALHEDSSGVDLAIGDGEQSGRGRR